MLDTVARSAPADQGGDETHLRGALAAADKPSKQWHRAYRRRRKAFQDIGYWYLDGAGEFSSDPVLGDPIALLGEWNRHPYGVWLRELFEAGSHSDDLCWPGALVVGKSGRPRMPGDWTTAYLGYVLSRSPAVQPFVHEIASTPFWPTCGFDRPPCGSEVALMFARLEPFWTAFATVAAGIVGRCKQQAPAIGEVVIVDATAFHSSAALHHACSDLQSCRAARQRSPGRLVNSTDDEILEARWRDAEEEPLDRLPAEPDRNRQGRVAVERWGGQRLHLAKFFIDGHWYVSRDLTSGFRRYSTGTQWFGGYSCLAIDGYTRGVLGVETFPADVQEWDAIPSLFDHIVTALGDVPYLVSVDKGFAIKPFFSFMTRRGVAVVSDLRKQRNRPDGVSWRTDRYDEDGIPRCQFCGGEGDPDGPGLGLGYGDDGEAFLRFRCRLPFLEACRSAIQSVRCEEEPRLLLPASRKLEIWHAVHERHANHEAAFNHLRQRYGVAGKAPRTRLYRAGVPAQRLRFWAATVVDWFKLGLRNGWITSIHLPVAPNEASPQRLAGEQDRRTGEVGTDGAGTAALNELLADRRGRGADRPYGSAWARAQRGVRRE